MIKFDVIVVGAGLNGLVCALAFGGRKCRRPLSVAIVDRAEPSRFAASTHDSRASALTAATQIMLRALGVWDELRPHAQDMRSIIVTDSKDPVARPALLSFFEEEAAPAALVENHLFFKSVLDEIAQSPSIRLIPNAQFTQLEFGPGLAAVSFLGGEKLKASLIVGTDGRNSPSRAAAGIKFEGWDYPQSAITLTVGHELAHEGRAEEHFTSTGVFAILPLSGNRASIVWTEPHQEAREISALPDDLFLHELTTRFGGHLGKLSLLSPRHVYPLSMMIASDFSGKRLALVGDAAHVVHPLAGLGLNLGFKDAAALADCVMQAAELGQDIGGSATLEAYARWRRFDTYTTAALLDGLNRLFANDHEALRLVRQAGLRLVDLAKPLKSLLMKEAAGQTGNLPRLMRGLAA